ncbi:IS110 family transposase [Mesorhizobium japonicum]|uniref:IS110 family transposase n=2 Tax=Mesorhizobium japonicum TaxID=2066070 RepID=A0ABX6MUZ3_9HYPH|nr:MULTISPECIES: IS110 family transposase [Mesorhizobium]ETA72679.1 transposase [Mesorhizobium japonicum R7A]OBP73530.1 transposase [Mesorhizobium loti]OBP73532.1 transposase [Mesorhizobium loti]OBP92666.1 transposase [Mesorhizobium loti]PBB10057.1 IS110 family transposase [Mesorhizobium loti]
MKHYAGLDLSMESTQVCIIDENGRKLSSEKAESTPDTIADVLRRHGPIERAVIETGRMSPAICLGLRELGVNVVCIDARQAHQSLKAMKANKTDPHDAAGLAQLARTGFYKEVHVKSPAAHGVRSMITARGHLVEARVRLDNMIRGLCATFGYRPGVGQGKAFVERIMEASHIPGLGEAITSLLTVRVQLVEQIKELDLKLRMLAAQSQACQILMSIPGVGIQTSAAFSAAIDEAGRFRQSRNAGAYFGLVPKRHQSGELDWTGRITKQGDSMVRKLLYEAANSILTRSRESFALKSWALKISKRRGLKKARVALARRLAVIMHAMLRDGTLFEA